MATRWSKMRTGQSQWLNETWRINKLPLRWHRTDQPDRCFGSSFSVKLIVRRGARHINHPSSSVMASCSSHSSIKTIMYAQDLVTMTLRGDSHMCWNIVYVLPSAHTHTHSLQKSLVLTGWTWVRMRLGRVAGSPVQRAVEECQAK